MSLLGNTVLLSVASLNGEDYTGQNGGSPVAPALVTGEDEVSGTVNVRVFLDSANTVRVQYVPASDVEVVVAAAPVSSK